MSYINYGILILYFALILSAYGSAYSTSNKCPCTDEVRAVNNISFGIMLTAILAMTVHAMAMVHYGKEVHTLYLSAYSMVIGLILLIMGSVQVSRAEKLQCEGVPTIVNSARFALICGLALIIVEGVRLYQAYGSKGDGDDEDVFKQLFSSSS